MPPQQMSANTLEVLGLNIGLSMRLRVHTPYRKQLKEAETMYNYNAISHKLVGILWAHIGAIGCFDPCTDTCSV